MGRRSIVVATWGNPFEWGKAYYRLAESENKVESVTSLSLLMEELSPNLTVVLIPETLICVDAVKRYGREVLSPKLSGKDEYRRLISGLRKSIEGFLGRTCRGKGK
jgi:CRISPR/Cas system-associated protein Csx1